MNLAAEVLASESTKQPSGQPPLAVDLDGTLVKTDLLVESVLVLLKQKPWSVLILPFWLLKGRANFKSQVARRVSLDVRVLPYREELLDSLRSQHVQGRAIVLATAADMRIARQVADDVGLFESILASDGTTNLSGETKRNRLIKEFGEKGFDYAGDGRRDAPVRAAARKAVIVNPRRGGLSDRLKALRPHHWLKNLLVFVPLLAAHRIDELGLVGKLLVAFLALGCMASSGYLINDLLDLESDRHHPSKRFRPFAAGDLPLGYALGMIPVLAGLGCLLGRLVSGLFLVAALTYLALSLIYSLYVKKLVILDVIFLAGLYTVRILAGSAAVAIWPSHWLLAMSTFLFFSLALVKRYGELAIMKRADGDGAKARSYEIADAELLASMGIASGYLAVLVLALYINSDKAQMLYGRYQLMWFLCPLLLYWISDIWLIAHRGRMPDDPVFFAMNDRTSRILILLMFAITLLAL